jgi:hypothetical protein
LLGITNNHAACYATNGESVISHYLCNIHMAIDAETCLENVERLRFKSPSFESRGEALFWKMTREFSHPPAPYFFSPCSKSCPTGNFSLQGKNW